MRLKERFPQTINLTVLTWLANMREHLVLSAESAVILRINCSIGVIPEKVRVIVRGGLTEGYQEVQC